MHDKKDWRLTNQEKYLKGITLQLKKYKRDRDGWDHDHCEFCWEKFSESLSETVLNEGYATEDNYRWICTQCFEDFKDLFGWKIR
jgi:hypothetical protein